MLRRLRQINREVGKLKAEIDAAERREAEPRLAKRRR
jgi:hypothetical protein